jgi:hypothetical protein
LFDLDSVDEAAPPAPHSRRPLPRAPPRKRSRNEKPIAPGTTISLEFPQRVDHAEKYPKRRKREGKHNEAYAHDLVSQILDGQERLNKRGGARHLSGIQDILSKCEQEDTKRVFNKLSKEFRRQQRGLKSDSWDFWYFEGCMDIVNRANGDIGQMTNAAKAIHAINSVVDRLFVTDGAVSTVIFGALAGE